MAEREEPPDPAASHTTLADVTDVGELALVLRQLRRRDARRRGGSQLSYRELAGRAGWSLGIIGGYFSGKILPPTDRFDVLVQLLDTSPAEQGALATTRDRVEERRRSQATTPVPVRPAQLPADVPAFTGRDGALRELDALAEAAIPVVVCTGMAGVGKSALAVHWAHLARRRFPDGQLFVNLRGYAAAPPLRPIDALAGVLRALGVSAGQVPLDLDEAAAMYRSLLTGRRLLVVLDNARGPDQIRPLLPGAPGSFVLVTSRDQLTGLVARDGARQLELDVLTEAESAAVLTRIVGDERVRAEPDAVAELARACARLPLALRIAAANLMSSSHVSIADYVLRLTAGDRLSTLEVDGDPDVVVRGAFDLSYRALPADARRMFRLLGLVPGPNIGDGAAAALAGVSPALTQRLLELLCRAHLLTRVAADRVALHDLLRCYAAERCAAETTGAERRAVTGRLYEWYECGVAGSAVRLYPERLRSPVPADQKPFDFADSAAALDWLDVERSGLVAAVVAAPGLDQPTAAWRITDGLRGYASQCLPTVAWLQLSHAAITAAEAVGDPHGRAAGHLSLAEARWRQGAYDQAIEEYGRVVELSREAGWLAAEAAALGNLGTVCRITGRVEDAVRHFTGSLRLNRRDGRAAGLAATLGGLGVAYRELGDLKAAADHLQQAWAMFRSAGSRGGEAIALDNLGETYLAEGRVEDALSYLDRALALFRAVGSRVNEAVVLRGQAAAHAAAGRLEVALRLAEEAYALSAQTADQRVDMDVLCTLATVQGLLGRSEAAQNLHLRALRLARDTGNRYPEAENLLGLAQLHQRLGAVARARSWTGQAIAVTDACGYRMLHQQALSVIDVPHGPQSADHRGGWQTAGAGQPHLAALGSGENQRE